MLDLVRDESRTLAISRIRRDGGTQPREGINEATIERYVEDKRNGAQFPPVKVIFDGTDYWLWDGFHRVEADRRLGRTEVLVEISQGTREDAQWESFGANKDHGLPRTREEKERAIRSALRHAKAVALSDSAIARHLGVSDKTVAKYRGEMEATSEIPKSTVRVGADGRTYNTANIGASQRQAAQERQAEKPLTLDETIAVIWSVVKLNIAWAMGPEARLNWLHSASQIEQFKRHLSPGELSRGLDTATFAAARERVLAELEGQIAHARGKEERRSGRIIERRADGTFATNGEPIAFADIQPGDTILPAAQPTQPTKRTLTHAETVAMLWRVIRGNLASRIDAAGNLNAAAQEQLNTLFARGDKLHLYWPYYGTDEQLDPDTFAGAYAAVQMELQAAIEQGPPENPYQGDAWRQYATDVATEIGAPAEVAGLGDEDEEPAGVAVVGNGPLEDDEDEEPSELPPDLVALGCKLDQAEGWYFVQYGRHADTCGSLEQAINWCRKVTGTDQPADGCEAHQQRHGSIRGELAFWAGAQKRVERIGELTGRWTGPPAALGRAIGDVIRLLQENVSE